MLNFSSQGYYLAIIGDIHRSRQISDRATLQKTFHYLMHSLNEKHQNAILSPFTVTLGDEFQAILKMADSLFSIKEMIEEYLKPHPVRMGIGLGQIETEIFTHTSIGMDGPCFRLARQQLELAKKNYPGMRFAVQNLESGVLNSLWMHIEILRNKQTAHQREVVNLYRKFKNQSEVAVRLGITQAAVSQALRGAFFYEIGDSEKNLIQYLNQFL